MVDRRDYDYELPREFIAQAPAVPRDASRLFIYDTRTDSVIFDLFHHLDRFLPHNAFLVMNETKVLPSRIALRKETGGKVVTLFLVNEHFEDGMVRVMVDRKVKPGDRLHFNSGEYVKVISQEKQLFRVSYAFSRKRLDELLVEKGTMPIPLYIKHSPLNEKELREKYQTVFAKKSGSSAAPTASLHFTPSLLRALEKKGIPQLFVTLHVGMGTFASVTEEQMEKKRLHEEWFEVESGVKRSITELQNKNKELVAVGTTVVRTLESLALRRTGDREEVFGKTDLFICPPYRFRMVQHLITNFHLPGSSLMMLVEAFLQYKGAKRHLTDLYRIAIENEFRFYSFGDAMLII